MTALYPGSFNPFTIGHLDIVARALKVVDEVVIAIGINLHKTSPEDADKLVHKLNNLFADCPRVKVISYTGLTVDTAAKLDIPLIIRGFRTSMDAEYERSLAITNIEISSGQHEIDTWIIPARPNLAWISSSMVRELSHFNHPVDKYLPTRELCKRLCSSNKKD